MCVCVCVRVRVGVQILVGEQLACMECGLVNCTSRKHTLDHLERAGSAHALAVDIER